MISKCFDKFNISREVYHSHNFNGNACKSICQRADEIFTHISQEVSKLQFKSTARNKKDYHDKIMAKLQTVITDTVKGRAASTYFRDWFNDDGQRTVSEEFSTYRVCY